MPFDPQNYQPGERQSYAVNGYLRPARLVKHILNLFSPAVYLTGNRAAGNATTILGTPVRAFFQMRLQVNFRTEDSESPTPSHLFLKGLVVIKSISIIECTG